jgi:transposase
VARWSEEGAAVAGRIQPMRWHESAEELYTRYRAEADLGRRKRLQLLWQVRTGTSARQAARAAGVGARTATRWLGWYRAGGLAAVLDRVPGHGARGRPGRLTPEQRQGLVEQAGTGAFRTYDEARRWVEQTFGVRYSYQGMYSVLARLEVHPKVPRPLAAKADPQAQEAWKGGGSPRH